MLILTRMLGEAISVGDHISIRVVAIQDGGVRLGIDAPRDIVILRAEVADSTQPDGAVVDQKPLNQPAVPDTAEPSPSVKRRHRLHRHRRRRQPSL